jgi:hypothetical protein
MLSAKTMTVLRRLAIVLWAVAGLGVLTLGYDMMFAPTPEPELESFAEPGSSPLVEAPTGHAYQYIAARNLTWEQARDAAAQMSHKGNSGYLATIDDEAEFKFVMGKVFKTDADVTYLGGRQTAPGEWRWVTGPNAAMDSGKGRLFWTGYAQGKVAEGAYANWMFSAFQHAGKWAVQDVCCVTLFSYRKRQFSTSLGNGDPEEGVAGYLVEFGSQ